MAEDRAVEDVPEKEYASPKEAEAAIQALTDDGMMKLMIVARYHWKRRKLRDSLSPEELLGESITRTLVGNRRWRRARISLLQHLDRSMESISGHAVGDVVAENEAIEQIRADEVNPKTSEARRFQRPIAEERLLARAELAEVEALFVDAPDAFAVLRLRAEGYTESEIMRLRGMNKRGYESARKKAEREITKYIFRSKERSHEKR